MVNETNETKKPVKLSIGSFSVQSLGVEYPDYFQGYGLGPESKYSDCCYGIGDTEAEALDDCLEMLAQSGRVDLDEDAERRIREDFGDVDEATTAADYLGIEEESGLDGDGDGEESGYDRFAENPAYFHVGIKWNVREERF